MARMGSSVSQLVGTIRASGGAAERTSDHHRLGARVAEIRHLPCSQHRPLICVGVQGIRAGLAGTVSPSLLEV